MDLKNLDDGDLLDELQMAQEEIPKLHLSTTDSAERRAAWQRAISAMRELERRYPPESDPTS